MTEQDPTRAEPAGTDQPTTVFEPPPAPPPPGPPPGAPRRLHRSRERRVVAGVAGGLGEYTGIDPVLFRVLFAVLTVFGGAGILLYVLGWLFLPEQDQPASPAEALIGRGGSSRSGDTVLAIALSVAALVLAGVLVRGDGGDIALLVVLVVGGVFLARHLDSRQPGAPGTAAPPGPLPQGPPVPPPAPQPAAPYQPYQAYEYPATTATVPPVTYPVRPPKPPRERSVLGVLTVSVLLLVLGVTAAVDAAGGNDGVQARHYLALAVGVLGLGLVVGAVRGRARGLIWLGIPLTLALVAVSTAEVSLQGGTGDRQYRPLSAAEIQPSYELGVGNVRLDLTGVDFRTAERTVVSAVDTGIGNIEVIVPRDVDVQVVGQAGIGEVELFGEKVNGTSNERQLLDLGQDGAGGGKLELRLEVGVGRVEVDRETA